MILQQTLWAAAVGMMLMASGCSAMLGRRSTSMAPTDPLYARVKETCGDNLIVRVVELDGDEAVCCVTYDMLIPDLHCMTATGATVANPNNVAEIKDVVQKTP